MKCIISCRQLLVADGALIEDSRGHADGAGAASPPAKAQEPSLAPAQQQEEQLLCQDVELEPAQDEEAPEGSRAAAAESSLGTGPAPDKHPLSSTSPQEAHEALSAPCSQQKSRASPAIGAEGEHWQAALAVPKGQRGKRTMRKRAASHSWASEDAADSPATATNAGAPHAAQQPGTAAGEEPQNDQLDNDEAIARALAGVHPCLGRLPAAQ